MSYQHIMLEKICSKITDGTHRTPTYVIEGIPFLRVKDIQKKNIDWETTKYITEEEHYKLIKRCHTKKGDILFSKNGTIGKVKVVDWDREFSTFVSLATLKPKHELICSAFLAYFLQSPFSIKQLVSHSKTGTVTNLHLNEINKIKIPFPPLEIQKRIVDLLDRAQALIDKRKEQIALIDQLTQSLFYDMFGKKELNTLKTIELVVDPKKSIRSGPFGSALKHSEFTSKGIAVLGIDNAVNNEFSWKERRFISLDKYKVLKRYTVYPEDIIITIMGTTGRVAVVPTNIPKAITTKHLATLTLNKQKMLPIFFSYCFRFHPIVTHQIIAQRKGAIMDGLNLGIIKNLNFPVPSIDIQNTFAVRVKKIEAQKQAMTASLHELEDNFNSLMQRAFKGDI